MNRATMEEKWQSYDGIPRYSYLRLIIVIVKSSDIESARTLMHCRINVALSNVVRMKNACDFLFHFSERTTVLIRSRHALFSFDRVGRSMQIVV